MQRLRDRAWAIVAPMFAAMIVASCAQEDNFGPRLAALTAVSGSGQFGAVGSTLAQPLVVRVRDQNGVAVEGAVVQWEITSTSPGAEITPSQSLTDATGETQASLRLGSTLGVVTVVALLGEQEETFTATATPAPPAHLLAVSGDNQTGTVATQLSQELVVKATDAVNGPKAGVTVSFAVLSGGGSPSAVSAVTDASGTVSIRWTLGIAAGPQTMMASVSGVTPLTLSATGVAGLPDLLAIFGGNDQTGPPGTPLPDSLRVRLTDRFGNPISGAPITWTPNPGDGTVNPAVSATDLDGRAATRWTLGSTGGTKTAKASGGGFQQTFTAGATVSYQTMSAGSRHSCGLAIGGVAYCWGYNGDGQLGTGDLPAGSGPVFALPQPSGTTGDLTFQQALAGRFHTCAVTLAGVGYCWGNNIDGRVGSPGTATDPKQVSGGMTFGRIAPGNLHSCGLDLAGRAFCWGANVDGQLGDSSNTARPAPAPVAGGLFFLEISAGGLHSCAIDVNANGYCWGNNASGQLGDGTTTPINKPVPVSGGLSFTAISAGYLHSCGVGPLGAGYCWGDNANGQLGDGTLVNHGGPGLVSGALVFTRISAGMSHSCGVTSGGALYCWGSNAKGQLGDGTTTSHSVPTLVLGALVFRSVAAGDAHTCGVTTSNVAYCWGDNEFGQVGDGSLTTRFAPVKVAFQP